MGYSSSRIGTETIVTLELPLCSGRVGSPEYTGTARAPQLGKRAFDTYPESGNANNPLTRRSA